jgi:glycosyltransferase involved in cell wall biosynthesis
MPSQGKLRVLVVAQDRVASAMAGPAIRSWQMARFLAGRFEVTLSVPEETDLESEGFAIEVAHPSADARISRLASAHDVVIAQWLPVTTMLRLSRSRTRTVYDLYDPVALENLAFGGDNRSPWIDLNVRAANLQQELALMTGDAFVCASEAQRAFWLGELSVLGRLDRRVYLADPSLRTLIDVVPFGLDESPPRASNGSIRKRFDVIGPADPIVLWAGGVWDWLDPVTVIDSVDRLRERRPDVRLVFMGGRHPNPLVAEMRAMRRAVDRVRELELDGTILFNDGWVRYAERGGWLLEADVGVSAHTDTVEARLAFRTRLLDYLWASLPVVATKGDFLAETLAGAGAARLVGYGDVDGWVTALDEALAPGARAAAQRSGDAVRATLVWPRALEPLVPIVEESSATWPKRPLIDRRVPDYFLTRLRLARVHRGTLGTMQHLARRGLERAATLPPR